MTKRISLLILFFSAAIVQAQVQKLYDKDAYDYVTATGTRTNEVFGVMNATPAIVSDIIFFSSDASLNTGFVKMYSGTATDESYDVSGTADGGYILSGTTKSFVSSGYDAFMIRTDMNGNISWSKKFGSVNTDIFKSGKEISGGDFIFAGSSDKFQANKTDVFLVRTDMNGDTIYTKFYHTPTGYSEATHVTELTNGDLLIAGKADTAATNNSGALLMRTDSAGNIIWTRVFQNPEYEIFYETATDSQGNIYAAGECYENNEGKTLLIKCDGNGNLLWSKKYTGMRLANAISLVNDTTIILAGYGYDILASANHAMAIGVDSSGNAEWSSLYGGARQSTFSASAVLQNTIYFGGLLAVNPGDDGYMVKADLNGNSFNCYQEYNTIIDSLRNVVEIYTNPWQDIKSGIIVNAVNPTVSTPAVTETNLQNMSLSFTTTDVFADGNCNGSATVNPTNGTAPYVFTWSNLQNSQTISGLCAGSYVVEVRDDFGCLVSDTVWINIISPENPICMVTVDSTSTKNYIVWDKPNYGFIDSFNVYRDVVGVYTYIGAVHYDSLSQYIDMTAGVDPNVTSYFYKITTVDSLGNESILSAHHKTLHLTTSIGGSGERNLIWDGYQGFGWGFYYRIMRDTIGAGTYNVLDSVSNAVFTYTDWTAPSGVSVSYLIEIVYPGGCTATRAVNHNSTRSNRSQSGITGSGQALSQQAGFAIIPNPASETVQLMSAFFGKGDVNVEIISNDGRTVMQKKFNDNHYSKEIDISSLAPGVYFVRVNAAEWVKVEKLVID